MEFQPQLPPELWTVVFRILSETLSCPPSSDIENVRLTCRLFENLATPLLLPLISCGPLSCSLTRLTAVSCHPVLSRSVKEVVFICNRYQLVETLPKYRRALYKSRKYDYPKFKEPKSEEENLDLETAFSQYGQHYNDQTAMENSGEVIARLCSALMRMPNVEKITVSPNLVCYLGSCRISSYFLKPEPAYNKAFLLIARVLSLTGANIRELSLESDFDLGRGVDGAVFRGISQMDLSHCCNAFRGLREVTITAEEYGIDGWMTGNMAKILSAATNLEILRFGSDNVFCISPKYIFSTTTWSRLTTLDFLSVTLDQGELLDLLRRHSDTLKEIYLSFVCLTNGSWRILLEGMKSSLSLEAISIENPEEKDSERDSEGDSEEDSEGGGEWSTIDIHMSEAALEDYLLRDGPHPISDNIP